MNAKKILSFLLLAFVLFFLIRSPNTSADLVRNTGEALGNAASSLANFVGSLA